EIIQVNLVEPLKVLPNRALTPHVLLKLSNIGSEGAQMLLYFAMQCRNAVHHLGIILDVLYENADYIKVTISDVSGSGWTTGIISSSICQVASYTAAAHCTNVVW